MVELVTSNYRVVEQKFANLREALGAAKQLLDWDTAEHVWFREVGNVLMLGRVTRTDTHFSHLTSLPTALL